MKGYVQVYTGKGKGKTTAALGLAVRACGAGLRVYIGQFIKKQRYNEIKALEAGFPNVEIEQYGRGCFIKGEPAPEDVRAAQDGLSRLREAVTGGKYDLVIADEINVATALKLLSVDTVLALVEAKPDNVELVMTGRDADQRLIDRCDLVTEMKSVKHYFDDGVDARPGIES